MVVAFDADILILLLQPSIDPPEDPETKRPVQYMHQRLTQLVEDLTRQKARVIVPAPALAEVLAARGESRGPGLVPRDLISYTEGPWRWARDRQNGRVRRYG